MGKLVDATPLGKNPRANEPEPAYDAAAGMPSGMPGSQPYQDNARDARVKTPPPAHQKSPFGK